MATNSKPVTKKQQEKQNEIVELTNFAEQQLIEKKKADLPKFIRKRKKEFIKELETYNIARTNEDDEVIIADKTIPMLELVENCFAPFIKNQGIAPQYSAKELTVIFDYFKECIKEMNKHQIVPPTKEMFCSLCGISTERFSDYKNGSSPEVRELCLRVEDFIANYLSVSGLTRKTDAVTSIFLQKSSLGRKEATEAQQVINNNNLILSDSEFAELLNKYSTKK
jgi:hypothetical protein